MASASSFPPSKQHNPPAQTQQRPVIKKRHTATRVPRAQVPHNRSSTKLHRPKSSKEAPRQSSSSEEVLDDPLSDQDEDMTSPFLQYCPSCEKQLPSSTGLYCSEECRKRDLRSSGSYFTPQSPTSPHSYKTIHVDIVPQMSPTPRPESMSFKTSTSRSIDDSSSSDPRGRSKRDRPSHNRSDSEAARYLAQFHSNSRSPSRTRESRPSTAGSIPGLSMTPLSLNTSTTPITPSSFRNPRKNRWSSSFETHSEELVTPIMQASEPSSLSTIGEKTNVSGMTSTEGAESLYTKRRTIPSTESTPQKGSLKQLLHSDGRQVGASGG